MHIKFLTALAAVAPVLGSPLVAPRDDASDAAAQLAAIAQLAYNATLEEVSTNAKRAPGPPGPGGSPGPAKCTSANLRVRREWNKLSSAERKAYTKAVLCLQSKPARTPASVASGAKTRYDDFVATHINQTLTIHYTGNFLSWHRYYTWVYEEALRNECGYTGTQPFWDWGLTAATGLENSAIFDGSDTSMSGNGVYQGPRPDYALGASTGLPPLYLPAGTGGGCVTSGPFKDMKVNLGPVSLDLPGGAVGGGGPGTGLTYNPRCLARDLKSKVVSKYANYTAILHNIVSPTNVGDFQMEMQGIPGSGVLGVHGAGHYGSGGDPGDDVFVSPGDPIFYLHHAQIDRTWFLWQALHPNQALTIAGTNTFLNNPPSANTTPDDIIDFGYAGGPPRRIGDLLSTTDGPFCYTYEVV